MSSLGGTMRRQIPSASTAVKQMRWFSRTGFDQYSSSLSVLSSSSSSSSSKTTTQYYYDSQSGMHVPVHNVQEISIILDKSHEHSNLSSTSFIPAHLYKEDPSSDMPERLSHLHERGVQGIIVPPLSFPRDVRNLQTMRNIAPTEDFVFFTSTKDIQLALPVLKDDDNDDSHVSLILHFDAKDTANGGGLENVDFVKAMNDQVGARVSTTISLSNIDREDQNPITIANQIGAWIDSTQGGDYIWVPCSSGNNNDDNSEDALERLCEELSYLDLVGKTVASRLIIGGGGGESTKVCEDLVEETMFSGVNKFVVTEEDDIQVIADIAESQGKQIRR